MSFYKQSHKTITLVGDYAGRRDANISYKFRFCDDGVYYYVVEQENHWRLGHRGRFDLRAASSIDQSHYDRTVASLRPLALDIDSGHSEAYAILKAHGLPVADPEEYLVMLFEAPHPLNPAILLQDYTFVIPNRNGAGDVTWSISPAS